MVLTARRVHRHAIHMHGDGDRLYLGIVLGKPGYRFALIENLAGLQHLLGELSQQKLGASVVNGHVLLSQTTRLTEVAVAGCAAGEQRYQMIVQRHGWGTM